MNEQQRNPLILLSAGLLGALAIGLGAYSAHGLEDQLSRAGFEGAELEARLGNFATGVQYQLHGALVLLSIGLWAKGGRLLQLAAGAMLGGVLVFSGLLYALAFVGDNYRWLGAIVPIGGLAMISSWAMIAMAGFFALRSSSSAKPAMNSDVVRVEELLTHQQHLLQELDGVVTDCRNDLDTNNPRIKALEETVRRLVELQEAAEDLPGERPPHY